MNVLDEVLQFVNMFWPFLILIAVFYFFMYRPQKKEEGRRKEFLSSLKKGQHVITAGGLHGVIKAIREDAVLLEITPKVQIKVERNAVQRIAEKSAPLKEDRNEPDVEDAPEEDSQEETK